MLFAWEKSTFVTNRRKHAALDAKGKKVRAGYYYVYVSCWIQKCFLLHGLERNRTRTISCTHTHQGWYLERVCV